MENNQGGLRMRTLILYKMQLHKPLLALGCIALSAAVAFGQERGDSLTQQLKEVVVTGFGAERNLNAPEMGRMSLSNVAITNLPVMFGEPDIVKTLQTLPGVSQGVEGFTGLYVRGGENDQNLFLYEGLPLYQVSHLGGIFSSFNVATVEGVDFFKAAFPARYGGRISSITDVAMKKPDFTKYTGELSVGLLSANAYLSGPIVKDRTAFSVGLRRTWAELVTVPTLAIINATQKKKGKKHIGRYAFTDFNARIDHRFNQRATAYVVGYYGHDYLKIGEREFNPSQPISYNSSDPSYDWTQTRYYDEDRNTFSWGNWGVVGAIDYRVGRGSLKASAYYSSYASTYDQSREAQSDLDDSSTFSMNSSRTKNGINDVGVKVSYMADFGDLYMLQAGGGFVHHDYLPEDLLNESKNGTDPTINNSNGGEHVSANEVYGYVDNTLDFGRWASLSAGVRAVAYHVDAKTYGSIEPRASLRVNVARNYSVKFGYAHVSQHVQQVSGSTINLPTDLWQPVSSRFKPLQSDQYSAGVYGNLPYSMYFSVEGWYKDMYNLLEYREGITMLNPDLAWDEKLTSGKGWAYGLDLTLTKEAGAFTGTIGYGLMWNWRKFGELNQGLKFPAKFDNRHKFNINANYRLNERIEFNAGWVFMTGNRLNMSAYNYDIPGEMFPDAPTEGATGSHGDSDGVEYYPRRNSVRLPAFHRLDLGMSLHKKLKNGREGVWSFGLYNAYCRMNPITVKKSEDWEATTIHRSFKKFSLIPIIPSVSYTYKF